MDIGLNQLTSLEVTEPIFGGSFISTTGGNDQSGWVMDSKWHLLGYRINYNEFSTA